MLAQAAVVPAPPAAPAGPRLLAPPPLESADAFLLALGCAALAVFFVSGWFRLRGAPARPAAFSPGVALLLLLAMLLLGRMGALIAAWWCGISIQGLESSASMPLSQSVPLMLGLYGGQAIAMVVYFWLRARSPALVPDKRASRLQAGLLAAPALLLAWPLVLLMARAVAALRGEPVEAIAHETLRQVIDAPRDVWFILLTLMVVFITPVMEEVMYRGMFQHMLVRAGLGRWLAIAITSAAFALMHGGAVDPHALAALLVLSLFLGWAYEKTGRLTMPIVMHALFNAGNLTMALLTIERA